MKTSKNKALVIAGSAGVGKTTLAKKYRNVIDIESSPYKWDYSNIDINDFEVLKGTANRIPNKNFPKNYIDAVKIAMEEYDVVCVWLHLENTIPEYVKNNIDVVLSYPSLEAINDYKERFINRGNNEAFADKIVSTYEEYFTRYNNLPNEKIILGKNETLEQALIKRGVKFIR